MKEHKRAFNSSWFPGGIYYMISRSLGPEFGAAIGLMFTVANSIAVSMYIVGFCEAVNDVLKANNWGQIIDGGSNDIRVVGIGVLIAILILAFVGMDWVTRVRNICFYNKIRKYLTFESKVTEFKNNGNLKVIFSLAIIFHQTQMFLLVVLFAAQVDFIVGSFIGPEDDDEKAKGFIEYNGINLYIFINLSPS